MHRAIKDKLILNSVVLNVAELTKAEMSSQMWNGVMGTCH